MRFASFNRNKGATFCEMEGKALGKVLENLIWKYEKT
jgi:hypothetical protein